MKALLTVAVVLLLTACGDTPDPEQLPDPIPPVETPTLSPSPSLPTLRAATVGKPFDIPPWQITVTSIRCGTATELLGRNDDNGQKPTDRVCVAKLSYTNTDKVPHLYGSAWDTADPQPVNTFVGLTVDGTRYEGHKWLTEKVNPGLTQTNELIFLVSAGVELRAVEIGDVRVDS